MNKLKIFELRWAVTDEKEWVAAYTNIHAIKTYCFITRTDLVELENMDEIVEVPESEWDKMIIKNIDYDPSDLDDEEEITFASWMEGRIIPDIIAGTMYE